MSLKSRCFAEGCTRLKQDHPDSEGYRAAYFGRWPTTRIWLPGQDSYRQHNGSSYALCFHSDRLPVAVLTGRLPQGGAGFSLVQL